MSGNAYDIDIWGLLVALAMVADSLIMAMVYRTCFTADDQYKPPAVR